MSNYAIGDIQGCYAELQALIQLIQFDPAHDQLWFTGDLVNRGPQSLAVLRYIKSLGEKAIVVLGNHDLHLLALECGQAKQKQFDSLDEILSAPDCQELCHWLRQQPLLHHDAKLNFTMTHAGIAPQWTLQQAIQYANEVTTILQSSQYVDFFAHLYGNSPNCWGDQLKGWERLRVIVNYFTRMRFCNEQGALELNAKGESSAPPPGFLPWFKVANRVNKDLNIIFGHWAALQGKTDEPNVFALDTGCVWGHCLTALRLEDRQYFSVPCSNF
jgi:bis(5'-nucleosyl)-tetraphosphatase (symmetrical)